MQLINPCRIFKPYCLWPPGDCCRHLVTVWSLLTVVVVVSIFIFWSSVDCVLCCVKTQCEHTSSNSGRKWVSGLVTRFLTRKRTNPARLFALTCSHCCIRNTSLYYLYIQVMKWSVIDTLHASMVYMAIKKNYPNTQKWQYLRSRRVFLRQIFLIYLAYISSQVYLILFHFINICQSNTASKSKFYFH